MKKIIDEIWETVFTPVTVPEATTKANQDREDIPNIANNNTVSLSGANDPIIADPLYLDTQTFWVIFFANN